VKTPKDSQKRALTAVHTLHQTASHIPMEWMVLLAYMINEIALAVNSLTST
jgi:hypothetical protein